MTSRERVVRTLNFDNPDRPPRDLWWLPAVELTQKEELDDLLRRIRMDIDTPEYKVGLSPRQKGQRIILVPGSHGPTLMPRKGRYVDEWGSVWHVAEDGVVGEVKEPVLDDLSKIAGFSPPWEYLETTDLSTVNRYCAETDKFMLSGVCARPFERMQFITGTEKLFIDLAYQTKEIFRLRDMIHQYNLKRIAMWLKTDVDGIVMMDDWGTQNGLLISPALWREFYEPLYAEYCDLIHKKGKYVFFHSDGWIEDLYDDFIRMKVDAINSQLFCMNIEELAEKYQGKITFWGEVDRQRILPFGSVQEVIEAVHRVRREFDDGTGGVIAQCEWGKNNPKQNIEAAFNAWNRALEDIKESN